MGDARRFDLFADLIAARLPYRSAPVADVAGGKGMLRAALTRRGFGNVTTWDKVRRTAKRRPGYRHSLFHWDSAPDSYRLVIGMHPDGGTDHIIRYAARHRVPFAVCPCCIVPSAERYHGPKHYRAWVEHLASLARRGGMAVDEVSLRMRGCASVLIGRPLTGSPS